MNKSLQLSGEVIREREWDWLPDEVLGSHRAAQNIRLEISCSGLARVDLLSKSDPLVLVYIKKLGQRSTWKEVGRTECIKNNHNPKFATPIEPIPYEFPVRQQLKFWVIDVDQMNQFDTTRIESQDKIGRVKCELAQIVGAPGGIFSAPLKNTNNPKGSGFIHIRATEIGSKNSFARIVITGHNLDKKDVFGKSDPYLSFYRINAEGDHTLVHESEFIRCTLDPVWKPMVISLGKLCSNHVEDDFMVKCFDWDQFKGHDLIGTATLRLTDIVPGMNVPLIHPKKSRKKGYRHSGVLQFHSVDYLNVPSFLDYIINKTEIEMVIGIDYSSSNGPRLNPSSLHYYDGTTANEYVTAMRLVGDVCAAYDHDNLIPAFGFGAELPSGTLSHCFPVNLRDDVSFHPVFIEFSPEVLQPYCKGIPGVVEAYNRSLDKLAGPTRLSPLIQRVIDLASKNRDGSKYYLLLIITDGTINDMGETVVAIREACSLPISILIVGVGPGDFSQMHMLDDDTNKLNFTRDIVNFLRLRSYARSSLEQMGKDTLSEIPKQLVSYMLQQKIPPDDIKTQEMSAPPTPMMKQPPSSPTLATSPKKKRLVDYIRGSLDLGRKRSNSLPLQNNTE
ncbi:hypothetical protein PROFUN_12800 [Planoprotostelium fungivorum]|uniref:Uncharacterized protein n=1 Tax=Planoprotostelium fungivorum TaxID=1890364 RepID=A0A2P6N6P1_9EUKA|nr:hypothetical protein PROFUN_12800 [Planoprotostelium fungivorum]